MAMATPKPLKEMAGVLIKDKFYVVHGLVEGGDDPYWRAVWWDAEDGRFYDTDGEPMVNRGLLVIPDHLPEVP